MRVAGSRSGRARALVGAGAGIVLMSSVLSGAPAAAIGLSPAAVGDASAYGEVQTTPVPGGVLKVTEYEDRTEVVGKIASCSVSGSASKPTLSSGRLSSLVKWNVKGCANKVELTHIIGDISSGTRLDLARWDGTRKAPTHVVHGLTRSCTRGDIVSALTISLDTFEYTYYESLPLRVTRC